jgi:glycosyltransferase involved in cell wall biosynthesis
MRLGYLVPEFPAQTHVFFWREIEALRAAGVDVRLISTRRPDPTRCRHEFAPAAIRQTHYLFPPSWRAAGAALPAALRAPAVAEYFRALAPLPAAAALRRYALVLPALELFAHASAEGIEHVHAHSCADAAHVVALCERMGGPPYSLTLHGDLAVYGTDHRAKMAHASFVAAVGTHLLRQIETEVGLGPPRIAVTCMGVDVRALEPLGAERAFTPGRLHVVTVARLNAMKGHVHAIEAVRRAVAAGEDVTYTIAGEGEHRPIIEERIRALGLGDRVRLVGTISEREVFGLIGRADAFVLPSFGAGEAWPVSVMEAMAAGLPVVSSIIGATPEMITNNEDGLLVEQQDQAGLAEALVRLSREPDLRRRLGTAARQTARARFDVRVTARRLAESAGHHLEGAGAA